MGLDRYLHTLVAADIMSDRDDIWTNDQYEKAIVQLLTVMASANPHSRPEMAMMDDIRHSIFCVIDICISKRDRAIARRFLSLLDQYAHEDQYPYLDNDSKSYAEHLRKVLSK